MDLVKVWQQLQGVGLGNVVVIGIIVLSLIQIAPLKLDPWSHFFKWVGKIINGDVMKEIDGLKKDVNEMKKHEAELEANNERNRILRFDDELRRKIDHSEEFFDQILDDVSSYRRYCLQNKDYPNSKAESAMKNIEDTYRRCKQENKFI